MPSGILIIDKSPGWTSQDAAAKLRGLYGERRVGHGGTLDPMATGVLPVFLGRATRAVEFFEHAEKEYVAGVRLGLTTDTEDTSGAVLSEQPVHAAEAQVRAAVEALAGEREQVPPMYSAVKIGGRKLYELARAGKEIERKARRITVIESELLDGGGAHWRFRVLCSKGTYVRTLCRELGETLGCGGCMESLPGGAAFPAPAGGPPVFPVSRPSADREPDPPGQMRRYVQPALCRRDLSLLRARRRISRPGPGRNRHGLDRQEFF